MATTPESTSPAAGPAHAASPEAGKHAGPVAPAEGTTTGGLVSSGSPAGSTPSAGPSELVTGEAGGQGLSSRFRRDAIAARTARVSQALSARAGGGRSVRLLHVDPMSAFKLAAAVNLSLLAAWLLATVLLWVVLVASGVWDKADGLVGDVSGGGIGAGMYFGVAVGLGLLEFVALTVMAPLVAGMFNFCAAIVGGVRVDVAGDEG